MASDYKRIAEEHEKRYGWDAKPRRIYKRLYSDKTHFIYELIQNADDSKSQYLELQLDSNALLVWNDGRQFKERDVRNICSLGSSDKDLTNIGTFGIGFKAVYNYTDFPEIYSDDERFRIRDFIKPEGIDERTPEIEKLVSEGKTIFRLPFKDNPHHEEDIEHLRNRLCNLSKERSLLFLRHLESVEWKDEHNAQKGSYACHRHPYDKIQNVPENESVELVELTGSLNGNNQLSETFLVFRKKIHPPKDVINKLLGQAEDEEEQQSIQQSAEELQPIEVAFKLQDDRITAMDDNCVLFAYLPTQKETHLRFLIQARYQTTPARDNIPKPSENPWNEWLVRETAGFLPEVLEQLKIAGLLEPAFFNVLPLKGEVENEFKPIAEALQKAMQERAFVPTQDGGYAKAENVFYPHRESLQELVESSWLYPNGSWLHTDIGRSGRAFEVMKEARVKEINVSHVLNWLEKQALNWFENRCEKWLRSLYIYLNPQKSQLERINGLERIKKLPLIRLENGRHVCASDELIFFPPDTDEAREEIRLFLNELPIVQLALLVGDENSNIENFLKDLKVQMLRPEEMIGKWIIPQYAQSDKPSVEENQLHVRYLFKIWDKLSGSQHRNLRKEISETPILWAYNSDQPETFNFLKPCKAYLPQVYTGDADLETYLSVHNGDIWFVDHAYMVVDSNRKDWLQFLKAIGAIDTPQVDKVEVVGSYEECAERGITRQRSTREYENGSFIDRYYSGYFDGAIEDFEFVGLLEVLSQISDHNKVNLSRSLWNLLIKAIEPLSPEKKIRWPWTSSRDAFFQAIYHRFYRDHLREFFDATFYRELKNTKWLPDEQGNFHRPSKCFAPTDDNHKVLGDSVVYLHPDFDVNQDNKTARWLAEKLGIHLNANTDSVINYLQTLSGTETTVEKVEPLYRFLDRQDARRGEEFKQKPLIFTSNPEPRWWGVDEVFWEDESDVFKNDRGCLKVHYPETLKPFFIALGVSEQASQLDYAHGIQEIATTEQATEDEVRARVRRLYTTLTSWQADQWKIIYNRNCWLGKKGNEWEFSSRNKLVRNDHPYIADIFEGEVPFWTFDDLSELTTYLEIEGCSQAKVEFHPEGDQEKDTDLSIKVRNLRPYIHAFLNSPGLCEVLAEGKSADVLNLLSVRFVEELKTTYTLKEISLTSPNPRPSFLEVTNEKGAIWLALAADKNDYASLIGDALQDYFGVKDLGRFTEHLLTKTIDTVLNRWKREGLRVDLCESTPEMDYKESEEIQSEFVDEEVPDEAGNGDDSRTNDSENETPAGNEDSETGDEDNGSTGGESDTPPRRPRPGRGGARWRGGSGGSKPNRSGGTGYGGSGGGEGEKHRSLKEYLANNSSLFGEGLELIDTEYRFGSGDEADILFEDNSGNPVTVEVKPPISSGSDQEVWQAVKYKHLAAVEYNLPCEEIRSILVAPEIPDDVKAKCEELGIEPFEVPQE
ncbi:MAG: endonuclease NucS [Candidatus Poribacteria bacterium]|nr:endonuclease NucS [Candidatus Poribacteria bacterium]